MIYIVLAILTSSPVILSASVWKHSKHGLTTREQTLLAIYLNVALSVAAVFGLLYGLFGALVGLLFPFLILLIADGYLDLAGKFLAMFIWFPPIFGMLVFIFAYAFRKTRALAWTFGFAVFLALSISSGEATSREQMCKSAQEFGISQFRRNTLFWSMQNHSAFHGPAHASFVSDDQVYIWSYRQMSFVHTKEAFMHMTERRSIGELTHC